MLGLQPGHSSHAHVTSQAPPPSWATVISSENWEGLRHLLSPFRDLEGLASQVNGPSVLTSLAQQVLSRFVTPCRPLVPTGALLLGAGAPRQAALSWGL